jgi:hypothetical protein
MVEPPSSSSSILTHRRSVVIIGRSQYVSMPSCFSFNLISVLHLNRISLITNHAAPALNPLLVFYLTYLFSMCNMHLLLRRPHSTGLPRHGNSSRAVCLFHRVPAAVAMHPCRASQIDCLAFAVEQAGHVKQL